MEAAWRPTAQTSFQVLIEAKLFRRRDGYCHHRLLNVSLVYDFCDHNLSGLKKCHMLHACYMHVGRAQVFHANFSGHNGNNDGNRKHCTCVDSN